jgi:hypothetical protein
VIDTRAGWKIVNLSTSSLLLLQIAHLTTVIILVRVTVNIFICGCLVYIARGWLENIYEDFLRSLINFRGIFLWILEDFLKFKKLILWVLKMQKKNSYYAKTHHQNPLTQKANKRHQIKKLSHFLDLYLGSILNVHKATTISTLSLIFPSSEKSHRKSHTWHTMLLQQKWNS